jgi:hypothetical protein
MTPCSRNYGLTACGVLAVPPRHPSGQELVIEAASIGQQHFGHQAAVPVNVSHLHGHSLTKHELTRELPGTSAEGLRLLRRVDAMQPNLRGLAIPHDCQCITVGNANDFAGELFLSDRHRWESHTRRHRL